MIHGKTWLVSPAHMFFFKNTRLLAAHSSLEFIYSSFNLTLILQSPYFLTTPCLSNHTGSFCIPLYSIQTLPLVYACCESYIFLLSIIPVFLLPLIWRFWGSEQLPNSYGNCVRRFRPLMPSQAVPMNMLKRSDKNTTVDNRIIYKNVIYDIYIWCMHRYSLILLRISTCKTTANILGIYTYTNIPWAPKTYQQNQKKWPPKKKTHVFFYHKTKFLKMVGFDHLKS